MKHSRSVSKIKMVSCSSGTTFCGSTASLHLCILSLHCCVWSTTPYGWTTERMTRSVTVTWYHTTGLCVQCYVLQEDLSCCINRHVCNVKGICFNWTSNQICVTGGQDTDDHFHSPRDLRPRAHHKTLPVHSFLDKFFINITISTFTYCMVRLDFCMCVSSAFLSEAYPSCTVTDIRFCFDVHKLMKLDLER